MKIYRNEKGKWCYSFIANGKRERRVVGLSKQECEAVACEARNKIKRDGFGIKGAAKNIFFEDFAKDFIETYAKPNKRSWQRDQISVDHLVLFFKGKYLAGITPDMIERYKAMRKDDVSASTVNRELACLKTLFGKAVKWGKLDSSPAASIGKFRENNARERILTDDEATRLIDFANPSLRPILIVALNTGMRRNEIFALKWKNVNLDKGIIFVENSKSGKSRKIPMNTLVRNSVEALPRGHEYLFCNARKDGNVRSIRTALMNACERAKIKGLRLHDLRHTAATRMIESGADIVTVSKILGHASITMTLRYCNPSEESMQRAVERLERTYAKNSAIKPTAESVSCSVAIN